MQERQGPPSSTNPAAARLNILRTLAETDREKLDLHTLFEVAGNDPTERAHVIDEIADLQSAGLIESRGSDFYALTQKGREASRIHKRPAAQTSSVGIWARIGLPALVLVLAFLFVLFSGRIAWRHVYREAPPAPGAPTTEPAGPR